MHVGPFLSSQSWNSLSLSSQSSVDGERQLRISRCLGLKFKCESHSNSFCVSRVWVFWVFWSWSSRAVNNFKQIRAPQTYPEQVSSESRYFAWCLQYLHRWLETIWQTPVWFWSMLTPVEYFVVKQEQLAQPFLFPPKSVFENARSNSRRQRS